MKILLVVIVLHCCMLSHAQEFLVNDSNGNLVKLDINGCQIESLGFIGNFSDLAAHPDGFIYAIASDGGLHRFKLPSTATTQVAQFNGSQYFALTSTADGVIYAATEGGTLKSYDPSTDAIKGYPAMGYGAAGDLTFYLGQLYMATTENTMVSIYPDNPELNQVVIDFSDEGTEIFGIVSTLFECRIRTFAISGDFSARIFEIGWEDGSFVEFCSADLRVFGGSSEFEFKASNEVLYIDELHRRNSLCEIADVTISIAGKGIGDSIQYSLDNVNFQSDPTFKGLDFGKYLIYMKDELGCEAVDSIELLPGSLEVEVGSLENAKCGKENASVVLDIDTRAENYEVTGYNGNLTIANLASGQYDIEIKDTDGCTDSVHFFIEAIPESVIKGLSQDPTSCGDNNGRISIEIDKMEATFSLDGKQNRSGVFELLAVGTFDLAVLDADGCKIDTSISVLGSDKCEIFIPTAFSPNQDGLNDIFTVFSEMERNIVETSIFDRWGSQVYVKLNGYPEWDGTLKGQELSPGSYTYIISLQGQSQRLNFSGEVTLLR